MTCGYMGQHFGANYPDAACIDGYLWDLDSCDKPGGGLQHGGDTPCPRCNAKEYAFGAGIGVSGNARQRRTRLRQIMRSVAKWAAVL